MRDKANDAATLLGEAQYIFQEDKKVLMDSFGRVDRQFGRKLTIDMQAEGWIFKTVPATGALR